MTLDNPNNWLRVFEGSFQMAQFGPYRGQIEPIYTSLLTRHTIRIQATSLEVKPTWKYTGKVSQVLGEEEMEFESVKLYLKRKRLFIFPELTLDYRLRFEPAPWLKEIQLAIDAYNT